MLKKHIFHLFTVSSILFLSFKSNAQMAPYGSLGLRRIYQSTLINPVLIPDSTAIKNSLSFVPFLPVSPFDFGFNASFSALTLGTVTSSIENKTLNVNKIINGMNDSKNADVFLGFNMSLFHLYFKVGNKGARIEISQRLRNTFSTNLINKNLLGAFINDDIQSDRTIDLSSARMRMMSWNEVAFGYTRPINKKWIVGGRLKYLTGIAYSDFSANNMIATLGSNGNSVEIDAKLRTSSLNPISDKVYNQNLTQYKSSDVGSLITNGLGKNSGFAIDAGVSYQFREKILFFGGFNDLGYISWSNNPLVYHTNANIQNFYLIKKDPITNEFVSGLDDVKNKLEQGNVSNSAFTSFLNTQFNVGATWQPKKWLHTSALADLYLVNGGLRYPGLTVAGTLNAGRWAEFTMNTGYTAGRNFRLGTGFSVKMGVLQTHLFTNNILGLFSAANLRSADFQFGLSWAWRGKDPKKVNPKTTESMMIVPLKTESKNIEEKPPVNPTKPVVDQKNNF